MSSKQRLRRRPGGAGRLGAEVKRGTGSLLAVAVGGTPAARPLSTTDQGSTNFSENGEEDAISHDSCDLDTATAGGSEAGDDARKIFKKILAKQNRDIVEWWDARSSLGPKPLIDSPDALWNAAREYFRWNEEHPLWETKVVSYKGIAHQEPVAKVRAMTLSSLCHFLDIPTAEWDNLRKVPDLLSTCIRIEEVIFNQKLQGASADLLNANIIVRDLQLKDHQEHTGAGGGPIRHEDTSSLELAKAVALIMRRGVDVLDMKTVNGESAPGRQDGNASMRSAVETSALTQMHSPPEFDNSQPEDPK